MRSVMSIMQAGHDVAPCVRFSECQASSLISFRKVADRDFFDLRRQIDPSVMILTIGGEWRISPEENRRSKARKGGLMRVWMRAR